MNMLEKTTINPPGADLVLSSGIIELKIENEKSTFKTNDIYDFIEWIKLYEKNNFPECSDNSNGLVIEYNDKEVNLRTCQRPSNPRHDHPLATLILTPHPRLLLLQIINDKKYQIEDFTDLMPTLRENMASAECMDLIGSLKDFRINKVTSIERTRDNQGTFAFICPRQRASNGSDMGKADCEPPKSLTFRIPVFEGAKDTADFVMDFFFDYQADSGQPMLFFKLKNLSLEEIIRNARKAIISERVREIELPAVWGFRENSFTTNEWMFLQNRVDGIGKTQASPK